MKKILFIAFIVLALLISACSEVIIAPSNVDQQKISSANLVEVDEPWHNIELTDVKTSTKFKIDDFKGKPVLLESFAVWCPVCLKQQQEIKKLKGLKGDQIIHISLDTDPNEDAAKVKEHIERNNLDWYFAISPVELTKLLIQKFGVSVVYAPGSPVILICPDQSSRLLGKGVKSAEELLSEIEKGC